MFLKMIAVGRLGRDAELKYTPQGKAVVNVSMACDIGWGENKKTQWVDLTIWEERAEKLQPYLTKGKVVYVEGTPSTRAWINKNTGDAKSAMQLTVRELVFCGGEKKQEKQDGHDPEFDAPRPQMVQPPPVASSTITDEDIPF